MGTENSKKMQKVFRQISDKFWPNSNDFFINLAKLWQNVGKILARLAKCSVIFKQKVEMLQTKFCERSTFFSEYFGSFCILYYHSHQLYVISKNNKIFKI